MRVLWLIVGLGLSLTVAAQNEDGLPEGLQTVEFYSDHVARRMKYDVVLPPDYEESGRSYPVIYLLHGFMQNYTVWGRNLGAAGLARELGDMILVMPDGGNSWYVDYAESHNGQVNQWESYLMKDLIPDVEQRFRVIARREGRAVAGLSMGGYGAVMLGLRHPDDFVSVASTSGGLGFARDRARSLEEGDPPRLSTAPQLPEHLARAQQAIADIIDVEGFETQKERTPSGIAFTTAEEARAHDPFTLIYEVPRAELPHFHIDAGTSDRLIRVAHELAQTLMLNSIPVSYMQREGRHDAAYWRRSVQHFLPVQLRVMKEALETHEYDGGR
ncbi:MAG: alpha/beta hydrolase-fold protein [Pseudohongiellaceae bacterium]